MAVPGSGEDDHPLGAGTRKSPRPRAPSSGQMRSGPPPRRHRAACTAAASAARASPSGSLAGPGGCAWDRRRRAGWAAPPAAAMTPVPCARRGVHQAGSTTWVRPQARQRARTGRTRACAPSSSRITRSRASPHGGSIPARTGRRSARQPGRPPPGRHRRTAARKVIFPVTGPGCPPGQPGPRGSQCCSLPARHLRSKPDRQDHPGTTA